MIINQEQVLERLALLQQEQDALRARLNAVEGAIMENKYWLQRGQASEAKPKARPSKVAKKLNDKGANRQKGAQDERVGA